MATVKITLTDEDIKTACEEYIKNHYGNESESVSLVITRGYEDRPGDCAPDSVEAVVKIKPVFFAKKVFPVPRDGDDDQEKEVLQGDEYTRT